MNKTYLQWNIEYIWLINIHNSIFCLHTVGPELLINF